MEKNLLGKGADLKVRNAKPVPGKNYRLSDGEGLNLFVAGTGGKSWQFRYKHNGKAQTITLKGIDGVADARIEADRLRKIVAAGDDPRVLRKVERVTKIAANEQTFGVTAAAWIESQAELLAWSAAHREDVGNSIDNHLQDLKPIPVNKILAGITAPLLATIGRQAPGMVRRVAQRLYAVMDFAVERGYIPQNPLPQRRLAKVAQKHFPGITELAAVGGILRKAQVTAIPESARRAHVLLVFTGMRVAEVVQAPWSEFDLEAGNWVIPRERMKMKNPERGNHVVPLPPVLLAQVRAWREADGPSALYICPSVRSRKIALIAEGVRRVYRDKLGLSGEHSPHSWRAAFSTICREARKSTELIESQLDHLVGSAVENAYNRSELIEPRRELLTWYESTLIAARDGATVLPLKRKAG